MGKTNFNMQLTDTQQEIMDFVTEFVYQGYDFSKAAMVSVLFKQAGLNYLGFNIDWYNISDEELLTLLKARKREEDKKLIFFMGVDKYKTLIEDYKKEFPERDTSYMENLLIEYESSLEGDKHE